MAGERLLLVDDEENFRTMLEAALEHHEFEVSSAANGREALAAAEASSPDLVLLDVMLPDLDGFDVLARLRSAGHHAPVLFISALDEISGKVRGFELGADDYLVKPFSLEELVARARAILRRAGQASHELRCGDLAMDDEAHRVTRGDVTIDLTPTEYRLLRHLLENQGRVLSKSQILDEVWGYGGYVDPSIVETYIRYLRRKVDTVEPRLIQTIRGYGYSLRLEASS
jgi:two-component system OmpR family response regulator